MCAKRSLTMSTERDPDNNENEVVEAVVDELPEWETPRLVRQSVRGITKSGPILRPGVEVLNTYRPS